MKKNEGSKKKQESEHLLRVSFPYDRSSLAYDPLEIHFAPEYVFLENVFSTLIETSVNGEIVPGLAEHYYWSEEGLVFKIRDDAQTIEGYKITAKDAEFSLKRAAVIRGNTHGNIEQLLCPNKQLKHIEDPCENIEVRGNELLIKSKKINPFLLPLLTAIDFAIIPIKSVDLDNLKIRDMKNTSGTYYVAEDKGHGVITLKANPYHYNYNKEMPQVVQFVPKTSSDKRSELAMLKNGEIDHITTISSIAVDEVYNFMQNNPDFVLHETFPVRNYSLFFTDRAKKELSKEMRIELAKILRQGLREIFLKKKGYHETDQFIGPWGDGSLTEDQLAKVRALFQKSGGEGITSEALELWILRLSDQELYASLIQQLVPSLHVSQGKMVPAFSMDKIKPHLFLSGPDTGFLEDIGFITYTLNSGSLGLDREEAKIWLDHYMQIESKEKRLELLREVHFQALINAMTVPMFTSSYLALTKKDWKMNLSKFYANNQFFLLRKIESK